MANQGEEFLLGNVTTEESYDPNWVPPSWFEFHQAVVDSGYTTIAVTPLGKTNSPKRMMGSTTAVVTLDDIEATLQQTARDITAMPTEEEEGLTLDQIFNAEILANSAIIGTNPANSAALMKTLCRLRQDIIHLTGISFKGIS